MERERLLEISLSVKLRFTLENSLLFGEILCKSVHFRLYHLLFLRYHRFWTPQQSSLG